MTGRTKLGWKTRRRIQNSASFQNVLDSANPDMIVWLSLELHVGTERAENISRKNFDQLVRQSIAVARTRQALYGKITV